MAVAVSGFIRFETVIEKLEKMGCKIVTIPTEIFTPD